MSNPIPIAPCGCSGANPCCPLWRQIYAKLDSFTGGGDTTNMLAWFSEQDITGVDWGHVLWGEFDNPGDTSPESGGYTSPSGTFGYGSIQQLWGAQCVSGASSVQPFSATWIGNAAILRSQALIQCPGQYAIIAWGYNLSAPCTGDNQYPNWCSQACQFTVGCTPTIVDFPVPAYGTLLDADDTILVTNYTLVMLTGATTWQPWQPGCLSNSAACPTLPNLADLETQTAAWTHPSTSAQPCSPGAAPFNPPAGFGPNWTASLATNCQTAPADPFEGGDPPP
jgi:hypothetical protein